MLLNIWWVKRELKEYLDTNENGEITHQNLGDAAKAVLRAEFILLNADLEKQEKS